MYPCLVVDFDNAMDKSPQIFAMDYPLERTNRGEVFCEVPRMRRTADSSSLENGAANRLSAC